MSSSFLFQIPEFVCDNPPCTQNKVCPHPEIAPSFTLKNLVTEHHLYCDRESFLLIFESFLFAGAILMAFYAS